MKRKLGKALSLTLSLALLFSLIPVAFANGDAKDVSYFDWGTFQNDTAEEVSFNLESVTYDWGEGLSKVHIYMRDEIDPESVDEGSFKVTAKDYSYTEFSVDDDGGFVATPKTKDFERKITGAEVLGKKVTLTLECKFDLLNEDGDGMGFGSYEVELLEDITTTGGGYIAADSIEFKKAGVTFNTLLDSFGTGRFVSEENAAAYKVGEEDKTLDYIDYRLYSPTTRDKAPLVVWLHGGGERGTDNRIQLAANRVPAWIEPEAQEIFGGAAYVLAPQTSIGWGQNYAPMVIALIEDIVATNNIDPERIYIGGCSMGGMGTWTMIQQAPDLFAAAFPICGGTAAPDEVMKTLVDLPIWIIHSVDDGTVNVSQSINAYNKLKDLGSKKVYMTLFDHVEIDGVIQEILGHWSWVYVHNNFPYPSMEDRILDEYEGIDIDLPADVNSEYTTFMHWLSAQKKASDAPYVPGVPPVTSGPKDEDTPDPSKFVDISGHWAEEFINRAVAAGLFAGTSENTFSPQNTMTRAMFVTVLGRLAGVDTENYSGIRSFDDVPSDQWYTEYVAWAVEMGITNGKSETIFDPNGSITRQELAIMLYRYLVAKGIELEQTLDYVEFSDVDEVSEYAIEALELLQRTGLLLGKPGNLFAPTDTATRAEVATVFARLLDLIK